MNTIQEEAPSRPTSGMTINIGFFPTVPGIITFDGPSYAISSSEYSQIEYENVMVADLEHERKMAVLGLSHTLHDTPNGYPDDHIIIECADNTNIAWQPHCTETPARVRLVMTRSQLMHSGWFVNWFNSPYYLARAGMKITWPRNPLACWEMVKSYMEDGYDRFGRNQITTYVCTNFLLDDRFIVLVRLYQLARVLDLFGLMDGAFAVLVEMEHLISPLNVLTLARYIFGGEECCENIINLRKRCLKWVSKHYDWLLNSEQWAKVIERSVPELREQWTRIKVMKKMISQEELKQDIRQNVSDANAIINAVKAVDREPETPLQASLGTDGQFSRPLVTLKKECTFTKLERNETGTNIESESIFDLSGPPTLTLNDADANEHDLNSNDNENPTVPSKPSLQGVLQDEQGNKSNVKIIVEGKQSVVFPRTSSFQEGFGRNKRHGTVLSLPASKNKLIGPLNSSLPCSISEPLLTVRRNTHIWSDANSSIINNLNDYNSPLLSAPANSDKNTNQQESIHHPLRRGVTLPPEALREPDGWPLSDVPLPDPLLPVPIANRAPSFDREGDKHRQINSTVHQAQTVTVFGLHRPGMGGSVVVPAREKATLDDCRAGVANVAKARELLGINEP